MRQEVMGGQATRGRVVGDGLLFTVLVLFQVAARCHIRLVLVYLRGSFLFSKSDYFFFQKSSFFFKLQSLFLVNSFKVLKFGLQLWNKGAVLTNDTEWQQMHRNVLWLRTQLLMLIYTVTYITFLMSPKFRFQEKIYIWNCLSNLNFKKIQCKKYMKKNIIKNHIASWTNLSL